MKRNVSQLNIICFLLFAFSFIGCNLIPNKAGIYVARGFEATLDTLKLYDNGNYEHIIYDKQKSKLININRGHWQYDGLDGLTFDNLLMIVHLSTSLFSNDIIINSDLDKYYEKVENY